MPPDTPADTRQPSAELRSFFRRMEILRFLAESREPRTWRDIREHLANQNAPDVEGSEDAVKKLLNRDLGWLWENSSWRDDAIHPSADTQVQREGSKHQGYRYSLVLRGLSEDVQAGSRKSLPGRLSVPQALALCMTRDFLHDMIPGDHYETLSSTFAYAAQTLEKTSRGNENWLSVLHRLAIFQRGQRLTQPPFSDDILTTIYSAMARGKCIEGEYHRPNGKPHAVTLVPWGVVFRLPKVYLVASYPDDPEQIKRQFLVHRLKRDSLQISAQPSPVPADFHIRSWLEAGGMDVATNVSDRFDIRLRLFPRIDAPQDNLIADLGESRLSDRQIGPEPLDDGTWLLTLPDTPITYQLLEWILGRGSRVEVLEPPVLRERVLQHAKNMLARYEQSASVIVSAAQPTINTPNNTGVDIQPRQWPAADACVFSKVDEEWGMFSNMVKAPMRIGDYLIPTSEHLFQALRFSDHPNIQREIIREKSPMAAKMKAKKHRETSSLANWNNIRLDVMRLCLRLKLHWNWRSFATELERSGDRMIIEKAPRPGESGEFWGAVPTPKDAPQRYVGTNMMGQLLMELRQDIAEGRISRIEPPINALRECSAIRGLADRLGVRFMGQEL